MPDFFSHPMAHQDTHHHSHTSKVQDSTSWAQDNPCAAGFQKSRDFYEAHGHHKLVTVEQYSQAVLEIVAHHLEAVASSSPLLISRRAYRDTTGHAPQHKPSPKVKKNDRQKVKVIEKEQRQEMRTTNRPRSYEQGDGCCAEKTRGLVVEQGRNGVVQAVKESNQRKVGYRVLGQDGASYR
ncbi:hypothetical protein L208DRAFT_1397923 [Tricholoma matsutake]|nr:hypothetical protein L208DRAFT_1397923 [Tricholoma matsutake 945]